MSSIVRRGFDPKDHIWFSSEAINVLRKAQEELEWLMNRGYKIDRIIELVGGHYQLSARQRGALLRGTSSREQYEDRKSKMLSYSDAKLGGLYIDGFNLIITLEVALSGSVLILGNDGVVRDLAGLRGTYRLIDKTEEALNLIGKEFQNLKVPYVKFYLDSPVSNSGRLKSRILEYSKTWGIPTEVELVSNPDTILSNMERVVTGDAVILDNCISWFNLSRKIIEDYIESNELVELSDSLIRV